MIKTFIAGIVLGVAAVIAALYLVPVVDQAREASIISVTPNGGNSESFHVNVPMDRIVIGAQERNNPLPPGMEWPDDALFDGARTEVFKLRNSRDAVVGVASRLAVDSEELGLVIEWVLHLPARGSMFATMRPVATDGGRMGDMRAGTREFEKLQGVLNERWVADTTDLPDAPTGRIELLTVFVSTEFVDIDLGAEDEEASP